MKPTVFLLLTPFALAFACGARVELDVPGDAGASNDSNDGSSAGTSSVPTSTASSTPSATATGAPIGSGSSSPGSSGSLGSDPVHCTAKAAPTATCAPGSNCYMEGDAIVCGPPTGSLNCGRVNCSGRCKCGGVAYGSWCECD